MTIGWRCALLIGSGKGDLPCPEYLRRGVFVEELAQLPPAVAEVDSALPAFVGYTAQAKRSKTGDLWRVAQRIRSLAEFEAFTARRRPASFIGSISTSTAFFSRAAWQLPITCTTPCACSACQWRRRPLHRVGRRLQRQRLVSGSALLGGVQALARLAR